MTGRVLGHYRIVAEIGHGGMGVVYRATDLKLHRDVALKVLPGGAFPDPSSRQSFRTEARALSRLNHPNIETVFDADNADGVDFLVTELVPGRSLADTMAGRRMDEAELTSIGVQIAGALHSAHSHGVIHGDVKPANVMILPDGRVKLVDFGLARLLPGFASAADSVVFADPGALRGTVPYMAPEQILREPAHVRSDIYSLGVTLYEMATGTRPFDSPVMSVLTTQILASDAPPLRSRWAGASSRIERVVRGCMARNPADRFASAADVAHALETGNRTPSRASRWLGWAAAVVLVVGLVWMAVRIRPWIAGPGPVRPVSNRVAIVPLRNLTGSPALDPIGQMAADWMTNGLLSTGIVDVVPTTDVFQAVGWMSRAADQRMRTDTARWLASESGAAIVVTGSYYRSGEALLAEVTINDASKNRVLLALEPVSLAESAPIAGLETLRQRLMAALGGLTHPRLSAYARVVGQPPTYAAYLEYVRGEEHFSRQEWDAAIANFARAARQDSTFFPAVLAECMSRLNLGHARAIDSLTRSLQTVRSRMAPLDRCTLDWLGAWLDGDLRRCDELATEAASLAPASKWSYQRGLQELLLGHAREAVKTLETLDPDHGALRGWVPYWETLSAAHHLLGHHGKELVLARQTAARYPRSDVARLIEVRARAAQRDEEGVRRVLEAARISSPGYPALLIEAARELRAHGSADASREIAKTALAAGAPLSEDHQAALHYLASDWEAAGRLFEKRRRERGDAPSTLGFLGTIAARRGDSTAARGYLKRLEETKAPFSRGANAYWQADILALLGDRAAAVDHLRMAFEQGHAIAFSIHSDPDLESIRNDRSLTGRFP